MAFPVPFSHCTVGARKCSHTGWRQARIKIQTKSVKPRLYTTKNQTQRRAPKATFNTASSSLPYLSSFNREASRDPLTSLHRVILRRLYIAGDELRGGHADASVAGTAARRT